MINPFVAILPSAGLGERFNSDKPKQYSLISSKTVMEFSLEPLLDFSECLGICIPVSENDSYWKSLDIANNPKISFIEGGETRLSSVQLAVNYWKSSSLDYMNILIHDSVRPCVRSSDIRAMLESFSISGDHGAILSSPVTDTLKEAYEIDGYIKRTIDRKNLWKVFTPQIFEKRVLEEAFNNLKEEQNFTDESGMVEESFGKIKTYNGAPDNIKITFSEDINLAKSILITQGRITE
ncbi:MAG TPA: 2-C-methyl-D-erythritol 4-phosphate cytidylyltransferase [Gammaproteobacteria bacterium]|nr:2-C-methyl-D-erythritol 4-phosphate cytidylyltransferase [Gammaproteobacteria bacterium]HIK71908.1 2-C-methyl-D-erythritol 4-phosphate cytidylyltransferase [Gammaproteobacteria bacterium]